MSTQLITQQEIHEYGPDFVDVMRRVVQEATNPLQAEIGRLQGELAFATSETQRSFSERMNNELTAAVPNWQVLNKDASFIAWSQQLDTFSGVPRRQLMQGAWNNGEPERVIAFFTGQPSPLLPQVQPQAQARDNLYTRAQITKFFDDLHRGR